LACQNAVINGMSPDRLMCQSTITSAANAAKQNRGTTMISHNVSSELKRIADAIENVKRPLWLIVVLLFMLILVVATE
jgi:hypothetical protein